MNILGADKITAKLKRIAYEIVEKNYDEQELYLLGIKQRGTVMANILAEHIRAISGIKVILNTVFIEKRNPLEEDIDLAKKVKELNEKVVILVDDVADTGRTLCYAIKPLLNYLPKKIQVAVLVDRMHKLFPIQADYVGVQLSTNLNEYVKVQFGEDPRVYFG